MYTRASNTVIDEAGCERPLRHKIEHPWIYDTDNPTSEPPDINYKNLIRSDQKEIDDLLEDESIHFTERCLRYAALDVSLEEALLGEYGAWAKNMSDKTEKCDEARARFFQGLNEVVWDDYYEVRMESRRHQRQNFERQFEQLHSGSRDMARVLRRLKNPSTTSYPLPDPPQELLNRRKDELSAYLAGSGFRDRESSVHTRKEECVSSETLSPATISIMLHQEDRITKERAGLSSAAAAGDVGQSSTSQDKAVSACAVFNYRLIFTSLLSLVVYEYVRRQI